MKTKRGHDMNEISISRAVVHTPARAVVYDSASPFYRFLHRQWSRFRAVLAQKGRPTLPAPAERILARYAYQGKRRAVPGSTAETRVHAGTPQETRTTVVIPGSPSLRQRIKQARVQRRRQVRMPLHETAAYAVVEMEHTWTWHSAPDWLAKEQRRYNDGEIVRTGAAGPLATKP
jgi:hypothetical protein